jgi:cytochrome P450
VFIGSTPGTVLHTKHEFYDIDKIYKKFKGEAPFVGFFEITKPRLLILEPILALDIMTLHFPNFKDSAFKRAVVKDNDPIFGRNPSMLRGEDWREMRDQVEPAFAINRIKAMYPVIENVCRSLSIHIEREVSKEVGKESTDAVELCSKFVIEIISCCIFGIESRSFVRSDEAELRTMGEQLCHRNFRTRFSSLIFTFFPILKFLFRNRYVPKKVENYFVEQITRIIKEREEDKCELEDILAYLIGKRNRREITDFDVAAHTVTFFSDGYETMSLTLAYALYELGKNPGVQQKLRTEIKSEKGEFFFDKINKMVYLEQVFNEVLRMHPPITFLPKECTEPLDLESINHKHVHIPKGLSIYIPIMNYHYDKEYFDEPLEFMPERFDPKIGGAKYYIDKGVFLPFGHGHRMCMGKRFAEIVIKTALVQVVKHFIIEVDSKTVEPITLDPHKILNSPHHGIYLNFKSVT